MNNIAIFGVLTDEVELRYTPTGDAVTTARVAVVESKDSKRKAVYVDVQLWKGTAEFAAEHAAKGKKVVVSGRLAYDQWEQDGQRRSKHYIVAAPGLDGFRFAEFQGVTPPEVSEDPEAS